MGLIDKIKNPKNFIPEITTIIGADGLAIAAIKMSEHYGFNEFDSSIFIPFMKSTGALIGKLSGYGYCHRNLIENDIDNFKSDLKKICNIMVPYQAINYCVQSGVLYTLQKNELLDNSDTIPTFLTILGVDAVCSMGRYFVEHKKGILK